MGSRPPGTLEGIRNHYRQRGFQEEPFLQNRDSRAIVTFAKPLPSGGRVHLFVRQCPKTYIIDWHVDRFDPVRDPIGHIRDIIISPHHRVMRIQRKDNGFGIDG